MLTQPEHLQDSLIHCAVLDALMAGDGVIKCALVLAEYNAEPTTSSSATLEYVFEAPARGTQHFQDHLSKGVKASEHRSQSGFVQIG